MSYITVAEAASLFGCDASTIRRKIYNKLIECDCEKNSRGRPVYKIKVESLPADIKKKYYKENGEAFCADLKEEKSFKTKSFEEFSEKEREEIVFWTGIVKEWEERRNLSKNKTDCDKEFVEELKEKYGEGYSFSVATLYRKRNAVTAGNIGLLCDMRGKARKGISRIDDEIWDYFMYVYLDQRKLPIMQCYELTKAWACEYKPESIEDFPHYMTFLRRVQNEIPKATQILGREGDKKCDDLAAPYILRRYEELEANDYWIADNHTLDVITKYDDKETTHRLHLTAFLDARSQVIVGWNLCENPSSASTILALRHAIKRFGIPKNIYMDNGSEFLTHDIAGRGHRTRKSQKNTKFAPHIFARLNINMVNALVRNARAKPIERAFNTFKGTISRTFETFCGGNVTERPENLKMKLKDGNVICDGEIAPMIADMIDGIYNVGNYGGQVRSDRGKSRIEVWNNSISEIRKPESEEDLNLMLLRSTRPQTVGRCGVTLDISGVKLQYWNEDVWKILKKKVYVRYDPDDLSSVRIYEADTDRFICTLPMSEETMLPFKADGEQIKVAQSKVKKVKKAISDDLNDRITNLPPEKRISIVDMQIRRATAGKKQFEIKEPARVKRLASGEVLAEDDSTTITIFDINRYLKG